MPSLKSLPREFYSYRHRFIDFGGVVITNLEPEHIEAHGSFEKYRASKAKIL